MKHRPVAVYEYAPVLWVFNPFVRLIGISLYWLGTKIKIIVYNPL